MTVAFIELQSGSVVRAVSSGNGAFSTVAPTGEYAVTTESQAGLAVGQAPVKVAVADGRRVERRRPARGRGLRDRAGRGRGPAAAGSGRTRGRSAGSGRSAGPAGPVFAATSGTGAQILFEPVTCFVAGEFPLLDSGIEPVASVARARVYFKGAVGDAFYFIEMTQEQGRFFGKLPRPQVEASPVTYYLQSTTTEFEESQSQEIEAIVVVDKAECGDRKVAAIGPAGAVTIFSAATGASIIAPAGFRSRGGVRPGRRCDHGDRRRGGGGRRRGRRRGGAPGGGGGVTPPPIIINPSPIPTPSPIATPTPIPITTFR